jgi:hypothetical protein
MKTKPKIIEGSFAAGQRDHRIWYREQERLRMAGTMRKQTARIAKT